MAVTQGSQCQAEGPGLRQGKGRDRALKCVLGLGPEVGKARAAQGPSERLSLSRWRARQLVKNIPPSDMAQIKAKVAAMGALQELRQDWGCRRAWARDYLSSVSVGAAGAGRRGGPQGRGLGLREHLLLSVRPRPCACSQAHPSSQTQIPLFRSAPSGPPAMTPQPWLPLALTWAGRVC